MTIDLHDYQTFGVDWMLTRERNMKNGILGDDMVCVYALLLTITLGARENNSCYCVDRVQPLAGNRKNNADCRAGGATRSMGGIFFY
jgi:hypothetical protein